MNDKTNDTNSQPSLRLVIERDRWGRPIVVPPKEQPETCAKHPAYEADYCPVCGTAREIGGTR